ncbi:284_t:CDS:2, partial [Racocetra fulgida]
LAAINFYISREYAISNTRIALTEEMNKKIKTSVISNNKSLKNNLETTNKSENNIEGNTTNSKNILELEAQRNIKDILAYVIPYLKDNGTLSSSSTIYLRISGDDLSKDWRITKTIDIINENYQNTPGHINASLFDIISIDNIVFDELHILLRITDRLWDLVLAEIKEKNIYNDLTCNVIINEMKHLHVPFLFWKDKDSGARKHTSLMGDDKIKVLRFFNLELLFSKSRAYLIRKLWSNFYNLYKAIQDKKTNPLQFKKFLLNDPNNNQKIIKGLYLPSHITSYIHAFVYHGWELLQKHQQW